MRSFSEASFVFSWEVPSNERLASPTAAAVDLLGHRGVDRSHSVASENADLTGGGRKLESLSALRLARASSRRGLRHKRSCDMVATYVHASRCVIASAIRAGVEDMLRDSIESTPRPQARETESVWPCVGVER